VGKWKLPDLLLLSSVTKGWTTRYVETSARATALFCWGGVTLSSTAPIETETGTKDVTAFLYLGAL